MSPYDIPFVKGYKYLTDLLITYDHNSPINEVHSKKFMAKMRQVNQQGDFMFLQKLSHLESDPQIRKINSYSFLALSLLFRIKKEEFMSKKSADIEKQIQMMKQQLQSQQR